MAAGVRFNWDGDPPGHNELEFARSAAEYPYSEAWREAGDDPDNDAHAGSVGLLALRAGANDEYTAASPAITLATTAGMAPTRNPLVTNISAAMA